MVLDAWGLEKVHGGERHAAPSENARLLLCCDAWFQRPAPLRLLRTSSLCLLHAHVAPRSPAAYPPTVFVDMVRDEDMQSKMNAAVAELRRRDSPVGLIKVGTIN